MVVLAIVTSTLLLADLTNIYIWVTVFVTLAYAGLGFKDDYDKVRKKSSAGISARMKLFLAICDSDNCDVSCVVFC